jgi:thiamine biosynthesis lipoprotein
MAGREPLLFTTHAPRPAMGTYFEAFLAGPDDEHLEAVAAAVLEEVGRLEELLSRFDPASEIARINREAGSRAVRVDEEIWDLLCRCQQYHRQTAGFFDVTASSGRGGMAGVVLDGERRTVYFARPGLALDLGGCGKGYALDGAGAIVRRFGVESALLHGGTSSILAIGRHPCGGDWPIDLRDPFAEDGSVGRLGMVDRAFSCSAVFSPGQGESDIVDPHSGAPLAEQAACVVLAATALEAEVYSTALLAMSRAGAQRFLQESDGPAGGAVGWIDKDDGRAHLTWLSGLPPPT